MSPSAATLDAIREVFMDALCEVHADARAVLSYELDAKAQHELWRKRQPKGKEYNDGADGWLPRLDPRSLERLQKAGARVAEPPHGALERGAEPRAGAHRRRPLRPANLGDSRVDHLETCGAGAGELGEKSMKERRLLVGAAAEGVQLGGALSLEQRLQFDPNCALVLEFADEGTQLPAVAHLGSSRRVPSFCPAAGSDEHPIAHTDRSRPPA